MKETLLFLSTPIVASILLAGILGYFGTHILKRGIIFIDIAIAQIAALGTMIGLLLGFGEESVQVQMLSYLFTLIIIGSFAFLKTKSLFIPPEAIIGIVYCVGLAMALLLAEQIPGGSNYITKTITGNILWVTWDKVIGCGFFFSGVGLVHILLGKRFIRISENFKTNLQGRDQLYNLLFYVTFGAVVVKAVLIGGIFLVFTLLIAPSAASALYIQSWKGRLIWSWIIGIVGTVAGILASYYMNISNGPAIVCLLGALVFMLAFIKLLVPIKN
ncbi:metal ABC transporter permease [Bacteroidota bacterium]